MNAPSAASLPPSAFVGRAAPLETLTRLAAHARAGHGGTVLISGEAGIGKSRLLSEAVAGRGALRGHCFESDRALPYAPLLDLLQAYVNRNTAEALAALLDTRVADLALLLPELRAFADSPAPVDPELERRRIFESLVAFFAAVARESDPPLRIVIEDVHWSDDTSLDFFLFLARRIQEMPLLLLLTYRHDEVPPRLAQWLAALERGRLGSEIHLKRLSQADVAAMVQAIFHLPHAPRRDFLQSIYRLTEGNPFFVEETLRSLVADGDIFSWDGIWQRRAVDQLRTPRTVEDAVLRRMERLSVDAKSALALAAVVGRSFDFELLQQLTGHDEATLLALVKEMIGAQLVREESAERLTFRHALTQQAVYRQLLARERRLLHRSVAETMEQKGSRGRSGALALHFSEGGAWEKTLLYATRAGEEARQLDAHAEAVEQFTRALEAARHLDTPPQAELYLARGAAYDHIGEWERAREDVERALELARQAGEREPEWRALLELGVLWMARDYGVAGGYLEEALAAARALGDAAMIATSLNRVGNWGMNAGDPAAGREAHREALALFQSLDDPHGLAQTYDLLGISSYQAGDVLAGTGYYDRAIELWRRLGRRRALAESLMQYALRHEFDTEAQPSVPMDDVRARGAEALRLARDIGWRSGEAEAHVIQSLEGVFTADYGAVFTRLAAAESIAQEIGHHQWLMAAKAAKGAFLVDLLAPEEATPYLEQALAQVRRINSSLWLWHVSTFVTGLYTQVEAWDKLDALWAELALEEKLDGLPGQLRLLWAARGHAFLARGDAAAALRISEGLIGSAIGRTPETVIPRLWLLRGSALIALKRPAEAESLLVAARDTSIVQELHRYLWRIDVALAQSYRAQGKQELAGAAIESARIRIEQCAVTVSEPDLQARFRERALTLLPAAPALTARQAAKRIAGGLTEREREVARLVAKGMSNREIAEALVVAERTVASHVGNILNKLGFDSRVQIATWAHEHGLFKAEA